MMVGYVQWHVIYNLRTTEAIQHFVDLCANFFLSCFQFSACQSTDKCLYVDPDYPEVYSFDLEALDRPA